MKTNKGKFEVRIVQFILWALLSVAFGFSALYWLHGDLTLNIINIKFNQTRFSLGLRIDFLSTSMFLMVALLGATIGRYSQRYLDGEERQYYFFRYLFFTLLAISLFVLSSNLIMLFLMWLSASIGLHKLLLYFPERKAAVSAARKKFMVSRLGDTAIILAIISTYHVFGTLDFAELFQATNLLAENAPEISRLSIIGVLFVLGAMTKSAQFPFHFWLPETMETPTPVSALMHAGIINAGGYLIIRLSPILQHADVAHFLLAVMGAITAVFGALIMMTQNSIKQKLAYSTISQMGIMMFSCGLGAFSLALFHIVAHSFYKAHAFLSTGLLVDESKKLKFISTRPNAKSLVVPSLLGLVIVALGVNLRNGIHVIYFTYAAVLLLGLSQNFSFSNGQFRKLGFSFFGYLAVTFGVAALLCGIVEVNLLRSLGALAPVTWGTNWAHAQQWITCLVTYLIFVAGLWLSGLLIEPKSPVLYRLYMYFWNGGYFSERTTRLFDRF